MPAWQFQMSSRPLLQWTDPRRPAQTGRPARPPHLVRCDLRARGLPHSTAQPSDTERTCDRQQSAAAAFPFECRSSGRHPSTARLNHLIVVFDMRLVSACLQCTVKTLQCTVGDQTLAVPTVDRCATPAWPNRQNGRPGSRTRGRQLGWSLAQDCVPRSAGNREPSAVGLPMPRLTNVTVRLIR